MAQRQINSQKMLNNLLTNPLWNVKHGAADLFTARFVGPHASLYADDDEYDNDGDNDAGNMGLSSRVTRLNNGVVCVSVSGVMMYGEEEWWWSCMGICSTFGLMRDINILSNDDSVNTIIFDIDSPGGTSLGVPELADRIFALREKKNLIAFTDEDACSAAYWLAAACNEIYASPSSYIGNVGTYITVYKGSMLKQFGIDTHVFALGDLKTAGNPDVPLTEKERQFFVDATNKNYNDFVDFVAKGRGIDRQLVIDTESRYYVASEAPEWMVDGVMDSLTFEQEVLDAIQEQE